MSQKIYSQQVALMLKVLPIVGQSDCFALKGGTAINFFWQDMPRLSVDIDLTYLPLQPRELSLTKMNQALRHIGETLQLHYPEINVKESLTKATRSINRLFISDSHTMIKIEPNLVLRGAVNPCLKRTLCQAAQDKFMVFCELKTLSKADLYAGKICAALDRQHPRDLFDIKLLYENGGLTNEIRQTFIIYLASGPRPMSELLSPNFLDIESSFYNEFVGMTEAEVTLKELYNIREQLVADIQQGLTSAQKQFLISIKSGKPDYSLMPYPNLQELPALKWKVININRMDKAKHTKMLHKLEKVLEG